MSIFDHVKVRTEADPATRTTLVDCELRLRSRMFVDNSDPHLEEAIRLCKKSFVNSLKRELYGEILRKIHSLQVQHRITGDPFFLASDVLKMIEEIESMCDLDNSLESMQR